MLPAMTVLLSTAPAAFGTLGEAGELPAGVEARTHEGPGGETYNHLFVAPPRIEEGVKYPLVVFLHGSGERGDDPAVLAKHFFPEMLSEEYRTRFPCYIIAPQCPAGERWADLDWRTGEGGGALTAPLAGAKKLLGDSLASLPVDRSRVYLTGLSMGGYGTWAWAAREPGTFAAALPICGGGDAGTAATLKDLPIWCGHGAADPAVPVERSREMVAAVAAAGGSPIYVEYPGVGHLVWGTVYGTPEGAVAWLFRQRRPAVAVEE